MKLQLKILASFIFVFISLTLVGYRCHEIPPEEQDHDNDQIMDSEDNCPYTPNSDQIDNDGNLIGDACQWSVEVIDFKKNFYDTKIVVDKQGKTHIAAVGNHLYYGLLENGIWNMQIIFQNTGAYLNSEGYLSMAVDSKGNPHISFARCLDDYYCSERTLVYLYFDGKNWIENSPQPNIPKIGKFNSIALDSNDLPHIVYLDETLKAIQYASFSNGKWKIESVDFVEGYPYTTMALDSLNRPHIVYRSSYKEGDITVYMLYYSYFDGQIWKKDSIELADSSPFPSLVIDSSDVLHLSFYGRNSNPWDLAFKYAKFNGTSWDIEIIESTSHSGNLENYISLAIDSYNYPHIAYFNAYNKYYRYARFDGTKWIKGTMCNGEYSYGISIALDSLNTPQVVLIEFETLNYLSYSLEGWKSTIIEYKSSFKDATSLTFDSWNLPHIAYIDSSCKKLKYAHFDGNSWIKETLDKDSKTGFVVSLAIDKNDLIHICYIGGDQDLRYAHFDGENWILNLVDYKGSYDRCSIVLDSKNLPHIGYEANNGNIKYAYFNGNFWNTKTVFISPDHNTTLGVSLDLDSHDNPHISYLSINFEGFIDLNYTYYKGGNWITTTINKNRYESRLSSMNWWNTFLKLDTNDLPHISFSNVEDTKNKTYEKLGYAYFNGTEWLIKIGDKYLSGRENSLALDSKNMPHIIHQASFDFVDHAYIIGNELANEHVIADGIGGGSIAIDHNDIPYISFTTVDDENLKFAFPIKK